MQIKTKGWIPDKVCNFNNYYYYYFYYCYYYKDITISSKELN